MAKARHGFSSCAHARAFCLVGLVVTLAGCTNPTFVSPGDAGGRAGEELDEGGEPELDAAGTDTQPGGSLAGGRSGDPGLLDDASGGALVGITGGDSSMSDHDAGTDGGLPPWALELVGTYAKRSINFSFDDDLSPATNTRNVEHSIVKISESGGQLLVTIQPCAYSVSLRDATNLPMLFKHAERFPALSGRILLGERNSFSSEPMVSHLGFEPSRGRDCTGGRRAPYEDQTWITSGSCQCFAGALPESQSDCRVTDTDGDGLAGITASNPGLLSATYTDVSLVFDYAVTFSAGELKSGKRVELQESRAQSVACINALNDRCSVGKNQLCPGGATRLIRLSEQVTDAGCEAVDQGQFGPVDPLWPAQVDCRAK